MVFEPLKSLLLKNSKSTAAAAEELHLDQSLITAFRDGNHDAFSTLYQRHSHAVFQFILYMSGDPDTADEITQEVFVWLIHHPDEFDPARGTLPAFLGGVARNFLRRLRRAQSRWSPLEDAFKILQRLSVSSSSSLHPETALDAAHVRKAVSLLPIHYREAIVLCDLQEKDYEETAQLLGCSVGTVRSRLHRGRSLLVRRLTPAKRQGDTHAL